jgi:hypothetical protein
MTSHDTIAALSVLPQIFQNLNQWNWQTGKYVMLGQHGLTQTVGETLMRVGVALSPVHVLLKFEYGIL